MQLALVLALLHVNQAFQAPRIKPVLRAAPLQATDASVCALLSLNARGVTKRAVAAAEEELGAENVFATKSLTEAHVAAKKIYERRYATVVACGGDGTLGALLRDLSQEYALSLIHI